MRYSLLDISILGRSTLINMHSPVPREQLAGPHTPQHARVNVSPRASLAAAAAATRAGGGPSLARRAGTPNVVSCRAK